MSSTKYTDIMYHHVFVESDQKAWHHIKLNNPSTFGKRIPISVKLDRMYSDEYVPMIGTYVSMESSRLVACQKDLDSTEEFFLPVISPLILAETKLSNVWLFDTVVCPLGHRVFKYLQCEEKSKCFKQG